MVEDDPVVMMDVVVNQVVHLVVNAFHHLVCHHLVVAVNEMVWKGSSSGGKSGFGVLGSSGIGTSGRCGDDGGVLNGSGGLSSS